jgi:hypothetical protein
MAIAITDGGKAVIDLLWYAGVWRVMYYIGDWGILPRRKHNSLFSVTIEPTLG